MSLMMYTLHPYLKSKSFISKECIFQSPPYFSLLDAGNLLNPLLWYWIYCKTMRLIVLLTYLAFEKQILGAKAQYCNRLGRVSIWQERRGVTGEGEPFVAYTFAF